MAETNMTLKQSYNSSGEKIYPLVSVDGIIDSYGIDDPNHRGKNLIALSLQGLDINPNRVDSSILTVAEDGYELTVKNGRIDIKGFPVRSDNGLQVGGNIHSFNSISVSKDVSNGEPIAYGTLELLDASQLTNGAKLTLMKKGDGNHPESFFSVDNGKLEYYDVTITSTGFDFFNGVLKRDYTTKTLSTNSRFQVLNGSGNTLLEVSNNGVIINKDTSITGKLTVSDSEGKQGAQIYGNTSISGTLTVDDATTIKSTLGITGKLTVGSIGNTVGSDIYGEFKVLSAKNTLLEVSNDGVIIKKDTSISSKLIVGDATTLNSTLNVKSDTSILGTLRVGKGVSTTGDVSTGKLIVSNSTSKKGAQIYGDTLVKGSIDASKTIKAFDGSIIIGDVSNYTGDNHKVGFVLKSSSGSFTDKYIYCGNNGQILRLRTNRSSEKSNSIQLLAGGDGYSGNGAAIDVTCGKEEDTLSDEVRIKPRLIVDGTFIKHQIIGSFKQDLPANGSTTTINSNFISLWGQIKYDTTLNFKLPSKGYGDAFTGFFFMGIKKAGNSAGEKTLIINFQNADGSVTSQCSEKTNNTDGERHLFFIPGYDKAHMIY